MSQNSGGIVQALEDLKKDYHSSVESLKKQFEQKLAGALEPAKKRLDEIQQIRDSLDREEQELLELLGVGTRKGGAKRGPRRGGRRVTAMHKKEVIGRFIAEGHIRNGGTLTRELRAALADEGLGSNDFRKLNEYMPSGWQAKSNGQRGFAALTTFHQV